MNRSVYDFVFVQDKTFKKVNFYVDIQVNFELVHYFIIQRAIYINWYKVRSYIHFI